MSLVLCGKVLKRWSHWHPTRKLRNLLRLSILSLVTRRDKRKFPASTALPVLALPSLYGINVPNAANNDQNSAIRFALLWLFSISNIHMSRWNIAKQCRTESTIRPATSLGDLRWRRNHDFAVRGNSVLSRNLESLSRDYYSAFSRAYSALSSNCVALSRDYSAVPLLYIYRIIQPFRGSTHPFRRITHNALCCRGTTQSIPPRLYDSPVRRVDSLSRVETKKKLTKSWRCKTRPQTLCQTLCN